MAVNGQNPFAGSSVEMSAADPISGLQGAATWLLVRYWGTKQGYLMYRSMGRQ